MNTAFADFVAPWRAAFPALELAHLYAADVESDALLARAVLLMECADAVWRASDPRVTLAKLGWWAEEWQRVCSGEARHPLAQALAPAAADAPLRGLLREAEDAGVSADWGARLATHRQIAYEYAAAFEPAGHPEDSPTGESRALCWTALVSGRYLAALASNQPAAIQVAPLATRARFQLSVAAPAAASAAASEGAAQIAAALQSLFSASPAADWRGRRGARVLTAMAIRELATFGQPVSRWGALANAYRAWQVARAV